VAHELEAMSVRTGQKLCNILRSTGIKVIQTDHVIAGLDESSAEVRTEEAGAAGDQDPSHAAGRCRERTG